MALTIIVEDNGAVRPVQGEIAGTVNPVASALFQFEGFSITCYVAERTDDGADKLLPNGLDGCVVEVRGGRLVPVCRNEPCGDGVGSGYIGVIAVGNGEIKADLSERVGDGDIVPGFVCVDGSGVPPDGGGEVVGMQKGAVVIGEKILPQLVGRGALTGGEQEKIFEGGRGVERIFFGHLLHTGEEKFVVLRQDKGLRKVGAAAVPMVGIGFDHAADGVVIHEGQCEIVAVQSHGEFFVSQKVDVFGDFRFDLALDLPLVEEQLQSGLKLLLRHVLQIEDLTVGVIVIGKDGGVGFAVGHPVQEKAEPCFLGVPCVAGGQGVKLLFQQDAILRLKDETAPEHAHGVFPNLVFVGFQSKVVDLFLLFLIIGGGSHFQFADQFHRIADFVAFGGHSGVLHNDLVAVFRPAALFEFKLSQFVQRGGVCADKEAVVGPEAAAAHPDHGEDDALLGILGEKLCVLVADTCGHHLPASVGGNALGRVGGFQGGDEGGGKNEENKGERDNAPEQDRVAFTADQSAQGNVTDHKYLPDHMWNRASE